MTSLTIPKDKIARRAYEIFTSRGGKPGKELDDWLQAERELARAESSGPTDVFQARRTRNTQSQVKYG